MTDQQKQPPRTFYRCHDCKETFPQPESENGETPSPLDTVKCPGCGERHLAMFYIELHGETIETATGAKR